MIINTDKSYNLELDKNEFLIFIEALQYYKKAFSSNSPTVDKLNEMILKLEEKNK